MHVSEVMTAGAQCIRPDENLVQAAIFMRDLGVGSLPVCGADDKLAGIVTDRDITIRAIAIGSDPQRTNVSDVMTPEVVYCFEDQEIEEAAEMMEERQIRRLAVLSRDKRLVGIVSLGDVAVKVHDDHLSGDALEKVSVPAEPRR